MRPRSRVVVIAVLAVIAIGSHRLLERTGTRTLAGDLSAIAIAVVAIALVAGLMSWARRR